MSTPQWPHESPSSHPDVDTLADLQEGLLEVPRATAVAAHVNGCAHCRVTRDALDDVRILLRDRGADDAAPEDVVRRLDDALAAAVAPVATASTTVTPLRAAAAPGRQPWRTRVLQAAAVLVLVAAVGALGYGGIRSLNGGSGSTDTASSGGQARTEKRAQADSYKITSSGRDYTDDSLRAALPQLLAGTIPAAGSAGAATKAPMATDATPEPGSSASDSAVDPQRLRHGVALAACVANLAGGPVTPLAVDLASFEKKPATIIVLPDQDDPSFVNVYAVAPNCPTGTFLSWQHLALP